MVIACHASKCLHVNFFVYRKSCIRNIHGLTSSHNGLFLHHVDIEHPVGPYTL